MLYLEGQQASAVLDDEIDLLAGNCTPVVKAGLGGHGLAEGA